MAKSRAAISKRKRFNIFKRDGFICQYCGQSPPNVKLELDHIMPVSRGGSDDDTNLITACFACNRGKAAGSLDNVPPSLVDRLVDETERAEQLDAFNRFLMGKRRKEAAQRAQLARMWSDSIGFSLDDTQKRQFGVFLNRLPVAEVMDAIDVVTCSVDRWDEVDAMRAWKYFCGVCWTKIKRGEGNG